METDRKSKEAAEKAALAYAVEFPFKDNYDAFIAGVEFAQGTKLKPHDILEAERYIEHCQLDLGFMGSDRYNEAVSRVRLYYEAH